MILLHVTLISDNLNARLSAKMAGMRMNLLVRTAFQDCQDSYSTHPKLVKKLRKFYDEYEDKVRQRTFMTVNDKVGGGRLC